MLVSLEWLETRTRESKHVCKFLGSLTRLAPTAIGGGLWIACAPTRVSTGGRAHSSALFFVVRTKESNTCVHVFLREIAWIRARPTTDRDLESQRHEKVNAWQCARLFEHGVPFSECGLSFSSFVPLCFLYISESRKEASASF